uniref:Phospholipase A2 n=1 Tax=Anser brachyrhynchus TaxID=132585 RepID=A0A8B9CSU0_9AVES
MRNLLLALLLACGELAGEVGISSSWRKYHPNPQVLGTQVLAERCSFSAMPGVGLLTLIFILRGAGARSSLAGGNLWDLQKMITKVTGRNAFLYYSSYGCYCGLGGHGRPKDATDRCCHAHDCCYSKLKSSSPGCHPTLVHYTFYLQGDEIVCEPGNFCQKTACECDKAAAECFKKNLGTYKKSYSNYPNFLCKGSRPQC